MPHHRRANTPLMAAPTRTRGIVRDAAYWRNRCGVTREEQPAALAAAASALRRALYKQQWLTSQGSSRFFDLAQCAGGASV